MIKRNRRNFLASSGGALLGFSMLGGKRETGYAEQKDTKRPNIIVIYTDDQRYDAVGYTSHGLVKTPNLDKVANRGMRFNQAYVTLSICSPSRAACLTGRYGSANGVMRVGSAEMKEGEKTFAHSLKDAGYRTGFVGKWHLKQTPLECGFDYHTYFISNGTYYGRTVIEDGKQKSIDGFIEDYNVDQSISFIRESVPSKQPFLLYHCTQLPHMNHEFDWDVRAETLSYYSKQDIPVPETWQDDLSGKPPYLKEGRNRQQALKYGYDQKEAIQTHFRKYYASITEMDESLGRLFDEIEEQGLWDNTYLLFMGDNGWMMGEHGMTSKVLPYEPSIHVPMFMCGPSIPVRSESRFALNVDIAPTVLEWAGLDVPGNMHGCSLNGLIRETDTVEWREHFLYEALESQLGSWPLLAIRTDRWKLIQTFDIKESSKLVYEELYDLKHDPTEMNNLARKPMYSHILHHLSTEITRLRKKILETG